MGLSGLTSNIKFIVLCFYLKSILVDTTLNGFLKLNTSTTKIGIKLIFTDLYIFVFGYEHFEA